MSSCSAWSATRVSHRPVVDFSHPHKTLSLDDLLRPEVRLEARRLKRLLWRLFLRGQPLAVNAISHRRFYLRRHKLWEYACGLAFSEASRARRVLEFGGAATLPSYLLARQGAEVKVLDTDASLVQLGQQMARRYAWPLQTTTLDITEQELPVDWRAFDLAMSFCVIEHMSVAAHRRALLRMARALAPGGRLVFSFEYGERAPGEGALRSVDEVEELVRFLGLSWHRGDGFVDTGERFVMDKRHPELEFTFGIVTLVK